MTYAVTGKRYILWAYGDDFEVVNKGEFSSIEAAQQYAKDWNVSVAEIETMFDGE